MRETSDIGVIGLAVMGENLILNMESKGFHVSAFNRTTEKVENFVNGRAKGKNIYGASSIEDLIDSLKAPRKVMLMVKAGKPVDDFIETLIPLLNEGDIIIDGGNSHFADTDRRVKNLEEKGLLYVGTGVSGGEEGALLGPSIMPGGSEKAWPALKPIFQSIAAKTKEGDPCCDWVGDGGAGHFVKMVHNGIEYGDMQLISEVYQLMKNVLHLEVKEMHNAFKEWNEGELDSYLIEITRDILNYYDEDGAPLIDKILDTAGQKGTGKWTGTIALDLGIPLTLITESVFARCLSALKEERVQASKILKAGPEPAVEDNKKSRLDQLQKALFAAKVISYTQGFSLMRAAAEEYKWKLNYGNIAQMWRGGCIIRSRFLKNIKEAFSNNPGLINLLLDPFFAEKIQEYQAPLRQIVSFAVLNGVSVPCLSAGINYYDGYRADRLPANMLQAQRDYFGAHTYERVDKPRGEFFHTNWTGRGGETSSSTYQV